MRRVSQRKRWQQLGGQLLKKLLQAVIWDSAASQLPGLSWGTPRADTTAWPTA